jgi:hypothetical protein
MKSYTDLEQSKKLAKFLPFESADMYYEWPNKKVHFKDDKYSGMGLSCWSLASLLSVLPNNENISTNLSKGGYRISTLEYTNSWFVDYEDETNGLNNCVTSADNPVDACVAMIEKLNELNLL